MFCGELIPTFEGSIPHPSHLLRVGGIKVGWKIEGNGHIFEKQLEGEKNDQSNVEVHRGMTRTQSDPQGGRSERPPRK